MHPLRVRACDSEPTGAEPEVFAPPWIEVFGSSQPNRSAHVDQSRRCGDQNPDHRGAGPKPSPGSIRSPPRDQAGSPRLRSPRSRAGVVHESAVPVPGTARCRSRLAGNASRGQNRPHEVGSPLLQQRFMKKETSPELDRTRIAPSWVRIYPSQDDPNEPRSRAPERAFLPGTLPFPSGCFLSAPDPRLRGVAPCADREPGRTR